MSLKCQLNRRDRIVWKRWGRISVDSERTVSGRIMLRVLLEYRISTASEYLGSSQLGTHRPRRSENITLGDT